MAKKIIRDDIDKMMDYGIFVPTRTIYVGSEEVNEDGEESGTDAKMAEKLIKSLHILDSSGDSPITIIMNNLGGDTTHGMAIYDSIKSCKNEVIIKALGHCMSMGSLILQAADKRVLSKHSVIMVHHGEEAYDSNHVKTVRSWVEFNKKYDKVLHNIYLEKIMEKHPNFTNKKLDKLLNFDTILLPEEAVELGLADEVEE